jgi:hypothetical protein
LPSSTCGAEKTHEVFEIAHADPAKGSSYAHAAQRHPGRGQLRGLWRRLWRLGDFRRVLSGGSRLYRADLSAANSVIMGPSDLPVILIRAETQWIIARASAEDMLL